MSSNQQILEFDDKNPIILSVNEFNDKEYLHIRRHYLDFEGDYKPTAEGVTIEYTIDNARNIFKAFASILSNSEFLDILIEEYYGRDDERTIGDS